MNDRLQARYNGLRQKLFEEISNLGISPLFLCDVDAETAASVIKQLLMTRVKQEHPDADGEGLNPEIIRLNNILSKTRHWPTFVLYIRKLKKDAESNLAGHIEMIRQAEIKQNETKVMVSKLFRHKPNRRK